MLIGKTLSDRYQAMQLYSTRMDKRSFLLLRLTVMVTFNPLYPERIFRSPGRHQSFPEKSFLFHKITMSFHIGTRKN